MNKSHRKTLKTLSTMTYKSYAARLEYSDEDACFIGHVAGINDVVGFHAELKP